MANGFWGFLKGASEEGTERLALGSIELIEKIAPGFVSASQLRALENELGEYRKNLAQARLDKREDMEKNQKARAVFDEAAEAMNIIRQKVEAANARKAAAEASGKTDEVCTEQAEIDRLMKQATDARPEYDQAKAALEKELSNDSIYDRKLVAAQKIHDVLASKIDQINQINQQKESELSATTDERKLAEMEAEVAAMEANANSAIEGIHALNYGGKVIDKRIREEQLKIEQAKLAAEHHGAKKSGGAIKAILAEKNAATVSADPFAGL